MEEIETRKYMINVRFFLQKARKIRQKADNLRLCSRSFFLCLLFCSDTDVSDRYCLCFFLHFPNRVDSYYGDFRMRDYLIFLRIDDHITDVKSLSDMIDR